MKQQKLVSANRTAGLGRWLLTAAALMMSVGAGAQTIDFSTGNAGKMLSRTNEPQLIGIVDGSVVIVDKHGKNTELGRYDMDQNELASVVLAHEKETSCYGGYVNGNKVDLLMVREGDEGMRVWHERLDATNLSVAAEPQTILEMKGNKKDNFAYIIGTSPTQELLAGVALAARKGLDPEMKVSLFDRNLEAYWHMSIDVTPVNQVIVNDSGEVALGYCSIDEKKPCLFTVVDGEHEEHFSFKITKEEDDFPVEATMMRYADGKLLMAVSVCANHKVVMPLGTNVNRIDFYCYDVAKDELTRTSYKITNAESARMSNSKEGKGTRNNWIQFGTIRQSIADDEGAYLMMDQTWSVTQNNIPVQQNHLGMLVVRVDEKGHVQWTRTMRLAAASSWSGRNLINCRWRSTADGIMLATAQNAKSVLQGDEKPVKNMRPGKDKATLSVYTLDRSGDLRRSHYAIGKQTLIGSARTADSHRFVVFLVGNGNKGQLGLLEFNK